MTSTTKDKSTRWLADAEMEPTVNNMLANLVPYISTGPGPPPECLHPVEPCTFRVDRVLPCDQEKQSRGVWEPCVLPQASLGCT